MEIGVKHKEQEVDKDRRKAIVAKLSAITLGRVKAKNHWMTNRMGAGDGVWMTGGDMKINEKHFVQGCSMVFGKIFRKMEILVDGTAVLLSIAELESNGFALNLGRYFSARADEGLHDLDALSREHEHIKRELWDVGAQIDELLGRLAG